MMSRAVFALHEVRDVDGTADGDWFESLRLSMNPDRDCPSPSSSDKSRLLPKRATRSRSTDQKARQLHEVVGGRRVLSDLTRWE